LLFLGLGIDLDGDGKIAPQESAAAIMAALSSGAAAPDASALVFRFDRADGYWLQGYANFLMAQSDFWLAHDFRQAFDESFHMLFPKAKLPMQDTLVPLDEQSGSMFASEWRIADFVSFIHLINWEVAEPERRKAARAELLETANDLFDMVMSGKIRIEISKDYALRDAINREIEHFVLGDASPGQ